MMTPSPLQHPVFRDDLPRYPLTQQLIRVTATTTAGPAGVTQTAGSSILAPMVYVAFVQQRRTDSGLPVDREPCLAADVNGRGLSPGFYLGRLAGSFNSLPVYEIIGGIEGGTVENSTISNLTITDTLTVNNAVITFDGGTITYGDTTNVTVNFNGGSWTFSSTSDVSVQPSGVLVINALTVTGSPTWTGSAGEMVWGAVDGILWGWNTTTETWVEVGKGSATSDTDPTNATSCLCWFKWIGDYTDFSTASTTNTINIFDAVLPQHSVVHGVMWETNTKWIGGGAGSVSLDIGITGSTGKYETAADLFAAAVAKKIATVFGWAPVIESTTSTVQANATISSDVNLDQLTQGDLEIWFLLSVTQ